MRFGTEGEEANLTWTFTEKSISFTQYIAWDPCVAWNLLWGPVFCRVIMMCFVSMFLKIPPHHLCATTYLQTIWMPSIVKPSRCTIFRVSWISRYVFRTVFPSIIRSSRLYTQHQVYVIQVSGLLASGHEMKFHLVQSTNLYDIYLMLYVQSWTPDDGRKDRPKHVEWYSVNSKIVHLAGFTVEIYHDARSHEHQIWMPES